MLTLDVITTRWGDVKIGRAESSDLLAVVGIALFSSVIPYAIEQLILRRVTAARFAILLALLPVTATVIGAIALHQIPGLLDLAGVLAICAAIVLSAGRSAPPEDPAPLLP